MPEDRTTPRRIAEEPIEVTRRVFLTSAGLGLAAMAPMGAGAQGSLTVNVPRGALAGTDYLTKDADFGDVERGDPLPYTLPPAKRMAIGMTRETWKLEVVPDGGARVDAPLTIDRGTALDWAGLMKLADKHAVRFLKVMTCNNLNAPLGMGLWEGVPLREVVWMTRPVGDIRRIFYYGHHNEDPGQMFRSSLSLSRVLEDPPGEYPVILCYKLNGEFLSGKRGGPVRMIVPEAYGFKSVKWLQRVVLTNLPAANDTYAEAGNDIESWMKTFSRILTFPAEVRAGAPVPVSGIAQVGISGLRKVQIWLHRQDTPLPGGDPTFTTAPWRDAEILAAPTRWGGGMPEGPMPDILGLDPQTHRPLSWPMRYSIAHWSALLRDIPPGKYDLRSRTIDAAGIAQPLPRPFGHSGMNAIDLATLTVTR